MGIRTIIAIGFTLVVVNAQAVTNSWTYTGSNPDDYFWDTTSSWSAGHAPVIADTADFITNATTKTVVIDDVDSGSFQNELTISNLTVSATGTTTNTLSLFDMNNGDEIPLHIFNILTIGAGGILQVTNSMLQVDGSLGVTGTMEVYNFATVQASNATISSSTILQFALGTNSTPVVVSKNLTLAGTLNVIDGGGFFTKTNYTLFTYGGILTYTGLTIGTTPSNVTCAIDTSVAGQVNLTVNGVITPPPTGSFQITSIARSGNDIVIMWTAASTGSNVVQAENGNCNTNNFADLSGVIGVSAGVTNSYTDVGGVTNAPSRFYRVRTQ